jgi:HK97 family phage prohead protease
MDAESWISNAHQYDVDVGDQPVELERQDDVLCSMSLLICGVDEETRSFEAVASTDAVDGHGDVVKQQFDLKRFKKNPVVLFNHNSGGFLGGATGTDALPIGRADNIAVKPLADGRKALQTRITLATADASPLAENVFQSLKQKTLRALSIGFRPGEITQEEMDDGSVRNVLKKNELFEISIVPVPANPETLARVKAFKASITVPPAAERGDGEQETETMTTEQQAALTKAEVERDAAVKERDALQDRANRLEEENKRLCTGMEKTIEERDAARTERDAERAKVVEADVDKLVGVKITTAEKPSFVKLAKSDRALFDQMIAQRPDLKLLTPRVTRSDNTPEDVNVGGASADIAAEIDDAAAAE